jgi:hypothetical protein
MPKSRFHSTLEKLIVRRAVYSSDTSADKDFRLTAIHTPGLQANIVDAVL